MTSAPSCGERLFRHLLPRLQFKIDYMGERHSTIFVDIGVDLSQGRYWYIGFSLELRMFCGPGYSLRPSFNGCHKTPGETKLPKALKILLIEHMPTEIKAKCIAASITRASER